jgi:TPR repeat protein
VAQSWFGRAARLGDAGAQFNLGVHCHRASFGEETQGEPESKVEAYKWFCLSSAQGYKGAIGACERLALTMTREEVADGEERAATFLRGSVV